MTIQEALDRVDMMRPNNMQKDFKLAALSELDGLIRREMIATHEENEDDDIPEAAVYTEETAPDTRLIAPFPYDEIYMYWLCCKVDLQNLEMDKHNNDRILFNNAYDTLSDYWTRTHMPKQRNRELHI